MRTRSALWFPLAALVLYIAVNNNSSAQAQQPPIRFRVTRIDPFDRQKNAHQVTGQIVGFSCAANDLSGLQCFIATTD
jgi:hypothetical protein